MVQYSAASVAWHGDLSQAKQGWAGSIGALQSTGQPLGASGGGTGD